MCLLSRTRTTTDFVTAREGAPHYIIHGGLQYHSTWYGTSSSSITNIVCVCVAVHQIPLLMMRTCFVGEDEGEEQDGDPSARNH